MTGNLNSGQPCGEPLDSLPAHFLDALVSVAVHVADRVRVAKPLATGHYPPEYAADAVLARGPSGHRPTIARQ